jgi:cell wall-associated NlpC family hydrolase
MNMSLRLIVTLFLLNSIVLFSQENITKHTIVKGETISSIAEKYEVKQSAILKLNPKAKNLLKLNSILLIPSASTKNTNSKIATNYSGKEHEVQPKETLYGIAKIYRISLKELNQANPAIESSGLKIGQKIVIPGNASSTTESSSVSPSNQTSPKKELEIVPKPSEAVSPTTEEIRRKVLPKETKYSIAKQYGIAVKELDRANPTLEGKALRAGQQITIPANASATSEIKDIIKESKEFPKKEEFAIATQSNTILPNLESPQVSEQKTDVEIADNTIISQSNTVENAVTSEIVREVLPKETKYAIAKQYGISVQELEKQNPGIKNRLPVGYKLNISANNLPVEKSIAISTDANSAIITNKTEFNNFAKPTFSHDFLDQLIERASENIGSRYRTGGTTKSGFDCSGLMCTTFGSFDIKLPRTSREQSGFGTKVNTEEAQKGDLIFFKTNGRSQINHVGMVVEVCEGEIKFIHSSVSNGVIISSTKEKYYEKNFSQINRVVQ